MRQTIRRSLWFLALPALAAPVLAAVTQAGPPAASGGGNPPQLKFETPSAERGERLSATCQDCHSADGVRASPATPTLDGQHATYTRLQLAAFRAGVRPSPTMRAVASDLSDQEIADLGAYYASRSVGEAWKTGDAALRARGETLFQKGDAGRNVMACAVCHGADGRGEERLGAASVTNQSPAYTLAALQAFKGAPPSGVTHREAMRIALQPLTDADLRAVTAYVSSMK